MVYKNLAYFGLVSIYEHIWKKEKKKENAFIWTLIKEKKNKI
jgi:hypothetical protein